VSDGLPSFVVIGAVKAATTWIAHQLRSQPGTFLPDQEPHFFSTEYKRGERWYRSLFAGLPAGTLIGEKSADYLAHPQAPARLAAMLPDARLVVQLRDPVARAYSDYCMLFRRGTVDGDITRHLSPGGPQPRFLQDGLYFRHLSRWLDHFPREQLHVLFHEDVAERPEAALAGVARHVGLPTAQAVAPEERHNDSQALLLPLPLRQTLAPLKPVVAPFRGMAWFERLRLSMARPMPYPQMSAELSERLAAFYADDLEQLQGLLDREMPRWQRRPCPA
jgi:hypothetical protein